MLIKRNEQLYRNILNEYIIKLTKKPVALQIEDLVSWDKFYCWEKNDGHGYYYDKRLSKGVKKVKSVNYFRHFELVLHFYLNHQKDYYSHYNSNVKQITLDDSEDLKHTFLLTSSIKTFNFSKIWMFLSKRGFKYNKSGGGLEGAEYEWKEKRWKGGREVVEWLDGEEEEGRKVREEFLKR